MGALAGIVTFRGDPPGVDAAEAIAARMGRGVLKPVGHFAEGPVSLAVRQRFPRTVDGRIAPTQPVVRDDVVVLLDGWVDDPAGVAREAGASRADLTDCEAVALAWRAWGTGLHRKLEGSFTAVIWDRRAEQLVLLRDRMGQRPLFWARTNDRFAFASELPALLAVPWVDRELATDQLAEYLSFGTVHAPRTLVRGVRALPPAHWLRVSDTKLDIVRYWTLAYAPVGTPVPASTEVVGQVEDALLHAVERRLPADLPAALYLSGGLGSTAIAAAAKQLGVELPTYTISFADDPTPELPFAGRVAHLMGLDHHEIVLSTSELAEAFDRTLDVLGQPVASPAAVLQLLLAEHVAAYARVALSGDGSEELFGGRMLDRPARDVAVGRTLSRLPGTRAIAERVLGSRRARNPDLRDPDHYGLANALGGERRFTATDRRRLLVDPAMVRPDVRRSVLAPAYADVDTDPLNALLHAWLTSRLQNDALPRADRTAAAAGLDLRFPLLDREVVEVAAGFPGEVKVRRVGGALHTRWPLQAMLRGVLPKRLLDRPKRGLPAPLDPWLLGPGRLFLDRRLKQLIHRRADLFRPDAIHALRADLGRVPGTGVRLWTLFLLDAWLEGLGRGFR